MKDQFAARVSYLNPFGYIEIHQLFCMIGNRTERKTLPCVNVNLSVCTVKLYDLKFHF